MFSLDDGGGRGLLTHCICFFDPMLYLEHLAARDTREGNGKDYPGCEFLLVQDTYQQDMENNT